MPEEERAHRIRPFPAGGEIVLHDQTAGGDEVEGVRRLVHVTPVEEEQIERCAPGKMVPPIADEKLDV